MNNEKWKEFDELTGKCYVNMAGLREDATCWEMAFNLLIEIAKEEREENKGVTTELYTLDDATDYKHDLVGWVEDCLDETDMREDYGLLLKMCNELFENFNWPEYSGSDLKFRKSTVLRNLGRCEEAVQFGKQWLEEEPKNIEAGTAYVYALMAVKSYEEAKEIIERFITDVSECGDENEIMFIAASRYYEAIGDKQQHKLLEKVIQEYDERVEEELMAWCEDDEDWDDDLSF